MTNLAYYLQTHEVITLTIAVLLIVWAALWIILPFCVFFIYRESLKQRHLLYQLVRYQKEQYTNGLKVIPCKLKAPEKLKPIDDPESEDYIQPEDR
jgi:hypothetical protein